MKRTLFLCFFILSGIVLGALIAELCTGVPGLSWLAFARGISFSPSLDLAVIRLNVDCYMGVSVAQIITVSLAIFLYSRSRI